MPQERLVAICGVIIWNVISIRVGRSKESDREEQRKNEGDVSIYQSVRQEYQWMHAGECNKVDGVEIEVKIWNLFREGCNGLRLVEQSSTWRSNKLFHIRESIKAFDAAFRAPPWTLTL